MRETVLAPLVFVVLIVFAALGISSLPSSFSQLAQVSGTTLTPTTHTVTVSSDVDCSSGHPRRYVSFLSDPLSGGYFRIVGSGWGGDVEPGVYPIAEGSYSWEARVRDGYMIAGSSSGTFTVSPGTCSTSNSTQATTTTGGSGEQSSSTVYFGVQKTGEVCSGGFLNVQYRFSVSPEAGGFITVVTPSGEDIVDHLNGKGFDRTFSPGSYTWRGYPRSACTGSGEGSLSVSSISCTGNTTTTTTNLSTTTSTGTNPNPTLLPVQFYVRLGDQCVSDIKKTPVSFEIVPKEGGVIALSLPFATGSTATMYSGAQYFPNGTFQWKGVPHSGYVSSGTASGSFTINSCPTPVYVSVETGSTCDRVEEGVPVKFSSTPSVGMRFMIEETSRGEAIPAEEGTLYMRNGTYRWKAIIPAGVNVDEQGSFSGSFTISSCSVSPTSSIIPTKDATILFFKDGALTEPKFSQGEKIMVRVDLEGVMGAELVLLSQSGTRTIGKMTKESGTTNRWIGWFSPDAGMPATTSIAVRAADLSGTMFIAGTRVVYIFPSVQVQEQEIETSFPSLSEISVVSNRAPFTWPEIMPNISIPRIEIPVELHAPIRGVSDIISDAYIHEAIGDQGDSGLTPDSLRALCSNPENDERCLAFLTDDVRAEAELAIRGYREELKERIETRSTATALPDADADGISDFDETYLHGTRPDALDSDSDGISDRTELEQGTNPLITRNKETSDVIVYETPKISGISHPETFTVATVEAVSTSTTPEGKETIDALRLSGKALPNALVTVFIYSEPVIVTVRADENGVWTYTLEKELPDGEHLAYVAVADASGRILAKSDPLPFVKEAAAVTLPNASLPVTPEEPKLFDTGLLWAAVLIVAGVIGFAIVTIGMITRAHREPPTIPGAGI